MANNKIQGNRKEMNNYICKRLRQGAVPKMLIDEVCERYGVSQSHSYTVVYECNSAINKSLEEISRDASEYIFRNLQSIIEDSIKNNDRKSALQGLRQLAEIGKLTENKTEVVVNFGFNYDV